MKLGAPCFLHSLFYIKTVCFTVFIINTFFQALLFFACYHSAFNSNYTTLLFVPLRLSQWCCDVTSRKTYLMLFSYSPHIHAHSQQQEIKFIKLIFFVKSSRNDVAANIPYWYRLIRNVACKTKPLMSHTFRPQMLELTQVCNSSSTAPFSPRDYRHDAVTAKRWKIETNAVIAGAYSLIRRRSWQHQLPQHCPCVTSTNRCILREGDISVRAQVTVFIA